MLSRRAYLQSMGAAAGALAAGTVAACGPAGGGPAGGPGPSKGPVRLVLLHAWDEARLPMMEQIRDEFHRRHLNITVEFDLTSTASGMASPRVQKLVTSVAGGVPPDVTMVWRGELPALALQGLVQPVDQFIGRDRFNTKLYYDAEWDTSRYQGKAYVLPNVSAGGWYMVYYNRQQFREAGIGEDQAPETWSQYSDYVKRLTKASGGSIQRLGGVVAGGAGGFILWLPQIFHIKANNPTIDFGIAPPPRGPKGKDGRAYIRGGWGYGIPTGVKHPAESWLLVRWLSATKEAACWFMQQQLRPSPMKECNEDRFYHEKLPHAWGQLLKGMQKDIAVPITPVDGDIDKVLNQMMSDVWAKKIPARDGVQSAAKEVQRTLDDFWARQGK